MIQPITILNSKLQAPQTADAIVRERMFSLFSDIDQKKLTVVVAGAGYGKSTIVSQVTEKANQPTVWYRVDLLDKDVSVFMTYLISGIQKYYPRFGQSIQNHITDLVSGFKRQSILLELLGEMESHLTEGLIVVIDDYYFIQECVEIAESIGFILERLPDSVHFVFISRTEPNLNLSRLRSLNNVIDINKEDLEFTREETSVLLQGLLGFQLSEIQISTLMEKTDGWAVGLILFYHMIKNADRHDIDLVLRQFEGGQKSLYRYFDENILIPQTDHIRDFMFKTAILSRLEPEFCNTFLNINNSAHILEYLEENHLFTSSYKENSQCYRYHYLLSDFLREKLKRQYRQTESKALHLSAARLYEKNQQYEDALNFYLEGEDIEAACRISERMEEKLFFMGRISFMFQFLEKIPQHRINQDARLLYLKSKGLCLIGKLQQARILLNKALIISRRKKLDSQTVKILKEQGLQSFYSGDLKKGYLQMKETSNLNKNDTNFQMEVNGLLMFLTSAMGWIDEGEYYVKSAQKLADSQPGETKNLALAWVRLNETYRYFMMGDLTKAKVYGIETLQLVTKTNAHVFLPLSYFHLAAVDAGFGLFSEGRDWACQGLKSALKNKIHDSQLAWLYLILGENYLGLEEIPEAISFGEKALDMFREQDNRWGLPNVYDLFYRINMVQGKVKEAEVHVDLGLDVIKGLSLSAVKGKLLMNKAAISVRKNEIKKALSQLQVAQKKLAYSTYYTCLVCLMRAALFYHQKQKKQAIAFLFRGLELADEFQYNPGVCLELKFIGSFIQELSSVEETQELWQKIMARSTIHSNIRKTQKAERYFPIESVKKVVDDEAAAVSLVESLKIKCLGEFKVIRGDREIPPHLWKNSKAVVLFKYLVHRYGSGFIPREVLLEVLWPDTDSRTSTKRLNVALTFLRNLLEPGRKARTASAYIIRNNDAYRLNLGKNGSIDTMEFQQAVNQAENNEKQHLNTYLKAESIYRGCYLENDLYIDWCANERERLNHIYLNLLSKITEFYEREKQFNECVLYAQKYLVFDHYAENIYRRLMRCYSHMGNRSMIIKTYEKCKTQLQDDLNCLLSKETMDLYRQLTLSKDGIVP